jgi:hypothetical protein
MFKTIINKIVALFSQPRVGVVVPVDERVEHVNSVMEAPYKVEAPVQQAPAQPKQTVKQTVKKAPVKKAPAKKPTAKKAPVKKTVK